MLLTLRIPAKNQKEAAIQAAAKQVALFSLF